MSQASRSIQIYGIYLALVGLALAAAPNAVVPLLGFRTSAEVWVRMVGLLTLILALYFLRSVRHHNRPFLAGAAWTWSALRSS